jgi:hypothetical protein
MNHSSNFKPNPDKNQKSFFEKRVRCLADQPILVYGKKSVAKAYLT